MAALYNPVVTCILISMLTFSRLLVAAPTGGDLLDACTKSVGTGFDSVAGQMCFWYVTPCDCTFDTDKPRVCLPESLPTESLAREVIAGLTQEPELRQLDASLAAATVLARKYPCVETE
jgi:hypothetical protein